MPRAEQQIVQLPHGRSGRGFRSDRTAAETLGGLLIQVLTWWPCELLQFLDAEGGAADCAATAWAVWEGFRCFGHLSLHIRLAPANIRTIPNIRMYWIWNSLRKSQAYSASMSLFPFL